VVDERDVRGRQRPEIHMVDSGLAAILLGATAEGLRATDPTGASRFGHLLETFVVTEVCKQIGWAEHMVEAARFRTSDGVEVDLVLETPDGRDAAIEVKASSSPASSSAAGLQHLPDRLGRQFVGGVLLTTGTRSQRIDDRIAVAPVDELWTG
jgi:predicted AAA+ superfamily ATPase